jgi:ABC-type Mn2+/Zn2+ transport system ATPase subunit
MQQMFLKAHNLKKLNEQKKCLFSNINIELNAGQILLITGANGCGKSTLLQILLKKIKPDFGQVEHFFKSDEISFVPQMQNMQFYLPITIGEVIEVMLKNKVDMNKILDLALIDKSKLRLSWNTASGGERQRTLITCAFLKNPKIIILDEPLNHLDQKSHFDISRAIIRASKEQKAIILASHIGLQELESDRSNMIHISLEAMNES